VGWAPDYVTTEELNDYFSSGAIEPPEEDYVDTDAPRVIATASRIVDRHCRRQFGLTEPETRRYAAARGSVTRVAIDDLMSADDLVVTIAGVALTEPDDGWDLWPLNAPQRGIPWTALRLTGWLGACTVSITAPWGWTEVPEAVKAATLLQAARLLIRRDSPYGIAGSLADGSEHRLLAKVDPDVAVSLAPYRRTVLPG
jgi:hypothetical protein